MAPQPSERDLVVFRDFVAILTAVRSGDQPLFEELMRVSIVENRSVGGVVHTAAGLANILVDRLAAEQGRTPEEVVQELALGLDRDHPESGG